MLLDAPHPSIAEAAIGRPRPAPPGPLDGSPRGGPLTDARGRDGSRPLLMSCWVRQDLAGRTLVAFVAMVTDRPSELLARVEERFGRGVASHAAVVVGWERGTPRAASMIGPAIEDELELASASPASALARGYEVCLERRFAA